MLEGIEILNQTEIMARQSAENPVIAIISCIFIYLSLLVYLVAIVLVLSNNKRIMTFFDKLKMGIFIPYEICLVACVTYSINHMQTKEVPTGKYIYEVTISDEISLKEFYEHYEVLDVKDDIFIIKEKE